MTKFHNKKLFRKSLLPPPLYQREVFPLIGIFSLSLDRQRGVGGDFCSEMSFLLRTP